MADTPLFWSRKGEVACAAHAPEPGTGRWQDEAWQELPPPRTLIRYQCQHCGSSPVRHVTRKPASVTPLILNVDDHEATLYARDRILRSNGFDVANAETG